MFIFDLIKILNPTGKESLPPSADIGSNVVDFSPAASPFSALLLEEAFPPSRRYLVSDISSAVLRALNSRFALVQEKKEKA